MEGIDTDFWKPTKLKGDYFLIAGRLQAHKHNELIVKVCSELGLPLHVVGTGRHEQYLRSIAKSSVKFLGRVSDQVLRDEYSGAKAFIYPQVEDFGLMPIEAASCGTATIAQAAGGSLETVIPGKTGAFFETPTPEALKQLLANWDHSAFNTEDLRAHAAQFSEKTFKDAITQFVDKTFHENSH
jgi:glycosyltransferase involved in cell wall biosynthesis